MFAHGEAVDAGRRRLEHQRVHLRVVEVESRDPAELSGEIGTHRAEAIAERCRARQQLPHASFRPQRIRLAAQTVVLLGARDQARAVARQLLHEFEITAIEDISVAGVGEIEHADNFFAV